MDLRFFCASQMLSDERWDAGVDGVARVAKEDISRYLSEFGTFRNVRKIYMLIWVDRAPKQLFCWE